MVHCIIETIKHICQGLKILILFFFCCTLAGCLPKADIDPPSTPPLSRPVIGYGVVTAPYTRLLDEPSRNAVTLGFVRERTVLPILERTLVQDGDTLLYWVYAEGEYQGWFPETEISLFDNRYKAQTAASQ